MKANIHGIGGPLHVSDQPYRFELAEAVLEACEQAGIPRNPDFNGAQQEGCGYYQTTTSNRRRWSTAKAYLDPARSRQNLIIRTGAHATRVLIEERPCERRGIPDTPQGSRTARARVEVIVSGGAYGSPQLLLLSGLGPAQHLQDMGVAVVRDMPAVGSNLHDHFIHPTWLALHKRDYAKRPGEHPGRAKSLPACATACSALARWRATASMPACSRAPIRGWNGPICRSTSSNGAPGAHQGSRRRRTGFPASP